MTQIRWRARDLNENRPLWEYRLTPEDIAELKQAVNGLQDQSVPLNKISRKNFFLPKLGQTLDRLFAQANTGYGLAMIKGVPVGTMGERWSSAVQIGISSYFGHMRPQPRLGWFLAHIRQFSPKKHSHTNNVLISNTSSAQEFHTDSCDIVGLMVRRISQCGGGQGYVASSLAIHDEMKLRHPDLLAELYGPFAYDRRSVPVEGQDPWYILPVFNALNGDIFTNVNTEYLHLSQALHKNLPRITDKQWEALAMFEKICHEEQFIHRANFEEGDIQFLNNLIVVHGRTAFQDPPVEEAVESGRRWLTRLWLSSEKAVPIPESYATRWITTEPGNRGGVRPPTGNDLVPSLAEAKRVLDNL